MHFWHHPHIYFCSFFVFLSLSLSLSLSFSLSFFSYGMAQRPLQSSSSALSYLSPAHTVNSPVFPPNRDPPPVPGHAAPPLSHLVVESPFDIYYQSRSPPFLGFEQKFRISFGHTLRVWKGGQGSFLYCFQNHQIDLTILDVLLTVSSKKIFLIDIASGLPQHQSNNFNFTLNPSVILPRVTFYYNAATMEFYSYGVDPLFDEKRTLMTKFFNASSPLSSEVVPSSISPLSLPVLSPSALPPSPHSFASRDLEKIKELELTLDKANVDLTLEKSLHEKSKKDLQEKEKQIKEQAGNELKLKQKLIEMEKELKEVKEALAEKEKKIAEIKKETETKSLDLNRQLNESAMKILDLTKQLEVKPGPSVEPKKSNVIPLRVYNLNSRKLTHANRLGGGGEGEVFKISLTFAVKQLRNAREFLNNDRNFIHAELDIPLRCSHPNILNVFGYGIADDPHLYILQSLKDFSLDKILRVELHSLFKPGAFVDFALQILGGLSYLHEVGVVHGDMKLQNVLVEEVAGGMLCLVLSDFGKSKEYEEVIKTMTDGYAAMATPSYNAPETLSGKKGPPSDVYAFGLMLWEIYVGRPVNFGINLAQIVYKILHPKELFDSMLGEVADEKIRSLIAQCLQMDPFLRPTAAQAMQVLEGVVLASEPPSVPEAFSAMRKPLTSYILDLERRSEVIAANVDP